MSVPPRRLALLDRDGTIIIDKVYLADPMGIEFAPGAIEGMKLLRDAGFDLILITNQSGLARGYFDEATLTAIHDRLRSLLAEERLALRDILYCPHGPDDGCDCRKPRPGMVLKALADTGRSPSRTVVIGDSSADVGAAAAAGVMAIRIRPDGSAKEGERTAPDFLAAARIAVAEVPV